MLGHPLLERVFFAHVCRHHNRGSDQLCSPSMLLPFFCSLLKLGSITSRLLEDQLGSNIYLLKYLMLHSIVFMATQLIKTTVTACQLHVALSTKANCFTDD